MKRRKMGLRFFRRKLPKKEKLSFFSKFDSKKIYWNLIIFLVLAVGLQYAEATRIGQETLDRGYDYLVKSNCKTIINDKNNDTISPELKLVLFDRRDYKQSYTKGYWTPREDVGRAVVNAVRQKAKVILIDFSFAGESPSVVLDNGNILDDSAKYIEHLQVAAQLARQQKTIIIVPIFSSGGTPPKGYLELLGSYRDVFRPANFEALRDRRDKKVRRFRWFSYNGDYAPVLSASLLGSLVITTDNFVLATQDAKGILVGDKEHSSILTEHLKTALYPENQNASSRIIFNILPREAIAREFGSGRDMLRGVLWGPQQLNMTNPASAIFKEKIVLIGSDFSENGDYHDTPLGPLAGSYIFANTLNQILTENIVTEARGANIIILMATGLLAACLYARFTPLGPTIFFLAIAIVSPWLSAIIFARFGIFIDVWLPALGIGLFNSLADRSKWQRYIERVGFVWSSLSSWKKKFF